MGIIQCHSQRFAYGLIYLSLVLGCSALQAKKFDPNIDPGQFLSGTPDALSRLNTALKPQSEKATVILHYGDSHTQAAALPEQIRTMVAANRPAAPGFLTRRHPVNWDGSVSVTADWTRHNWLRRKSSPPFGPMGIAYETKRAGAELSLSLPPDILKQGVIRVTVLYGRTPGHRPFSLMSKERTLKFVSYETDPNAVGTNDPKNTADVSTVPPSALGTAMVVLPPESTEVRLLVEPAIDEAATLRFFGFLVQTEAASVEYDVLGVGSTRPLHMVEHGDETVGAYIKHRQPQMIVTWFGSNSSVDSDLDLTKYGDDYRAHLSRLLAAKPNTACLAIGPPDLARAKKHCYLTGRERRLAKRGRRARKRLRRILRTKRKAMVCSPDTLLNRRKRGRYRFPVPGVRTMGQWKRYVRKCTPQTVPNLRPIIAIQRQIAHELGCGYFDSFAYMGGKGAILDWACRDEDRLAGYDLVHLTKAGYQTLGAAIGRALHQTLPLAESEKAP